MRTTTRFTLIAVACLAAAGLAGCTAKTTASNTPSATQTVTTTPAPAPSASSTTPPVTPTPSSGAGSGTGAGTAVAACTSAHLRASIAVNDGGGAAGSTYVNVVLTNKGTASCTLQGWPGVSFVGGGNGTQIGKPAVFDRTSAHATVTVVPQGTVSSVLRISQADNYSNADCSPTKADGFRIYPPGQKASLFAQETGFTACASKTVSLLTVSGLK
jgi:hypothetical protein